MCGSRRVRRRIGPLKLDDRLTIDDVAVDQCAECGERFLDPEAVSKVSAAMRRPRA